MFKRILLISFVSVLVFGVYCLLPTTPNEDLLQKIENIKSSSKYGRFSDKYTIVIDYDKFILRKRLWIIENKTNKIVLNSHVSHAQKSGYLFVNSISNVEGSNKSSIGVFKTLGRYESKHGKGEYKIGMQIKGLEKGKNDNVTKRAITFHTSYGLWSDGCFMTFPKTNKKIIDLTENGTLLYVHKS